MIYKYVLLVCGLSVHLSSAFCCTQAFKFDEVQFLCFAICHLCYECHI
jgi:hypothetical protein